MRVIQETHTHYTHAQEQWLDERRNLCDAGQCRGHKTIRHAYGRKYEREAGWMIRNKVN